MDVQLAITLAVGFAVGSIIERTVFTLFGYYSFRKRVKRQLRESSMSNDMLVEFKRAHGLEEEPSGEAPGH